ncbi:MAG TPA: hypothetical protein VFQ80_04570 [Thermomicrobiales bacterium]|nr:hypothetical protein [Thermomicrobiales bacterium]
MTDQATDTAKKALAESKDARAEQDKQRAERLKGKPTPTQEENDLIKLGGHPELEDDGSGADPNNFSQKSLEAKKPGGGYQTRATEATHRK